MLDGYNRWRDRQRGREHRNEVRSLRGAYYLPYLLRVEDGAMVYFRFDRFWRVQLVDELDQAHWWSRPLGGRDEGTVMDLIDAWPGQGRDGRYWLMLTDRSGTATWLWSPRGWLMRDEFAAGLAAGPGDDDEDGGGDDAPEEDDDEEDDWGIGRP